MKNERVVKKNGMLLILSTKVRKHEKFKKYLLSGMTLNFDFKRVYLVMDIVHDDIATGDQEQCHPRGKKYAKCQTYGHGNHEFCLNTAFQKHGSETGKCC